jgi:hypothetical protein
LNQCLQPEVGEYLANRPLLAATSASTPASPLESREGRNISHDSKESSSSSSVFPQSTSASRPESSAPLSLEGLHPRSISEHYQEPGILPCDTESSEYPEFDEDDVSFRLRLLVKNNYFLPPAHSKPSPLSLASPTLKTPKKTSRSTTPTFLDIFRVGKSKSKPPTPESSTESLTPVLRTTSDSTTASGYAPRSQSHSLPQSPSSSSTNQDRAGRVVVVREKMDDIITAAKQAEQDMKVREGRRDRDGVSQRGAPDFVNVIDPTDAVDMPPPQADYPFVMQTSAMHGLGVQDSVGAAVLAEYLPPMDAEETAWRKALLHEAVNLSLHSSLSTSDHHTPSVSPSSPVSLSHSNHSLRRILDLRIFSHLGMDDDYDELSAPFSATHSKARRKAELSSGQSQNSSSRPSSYLPRRAETPAIFHPLAPPPRRPIIKHSFSQTELSNDERAHRSSSGLSHSSKILRKTMSSPMLSDTYDSAISPSSTMAPPPVPKLSTSLLVQSPNSTTSFVSRRGTRSQIQSMSTYYSDEEEAHHRPSMTVSIPTNGRPSLSDYSQPSPAASAFKDALDNYHQSSQEVITSSTPQMNASQPRTSEDEATTSPRRSADARFSTMSPPPRVSSSLADIALSPPPRKSSLRSPVADDVHNATPLPATTTRHHPQLAHPPTPNTPASPIAERRGVSPMPASLHIPTGHIPVAIQSAPPPSSPTSFFDVVEEEHPNAVDELSSSDESDMEESYGGIARDPAIDAGNSESMHAKSTPRPETSKSETSKPSLELKKPLFMRLGNNSTPHVNRPQFNSVDRKRPISNTPHRMSYFSRKKGKSDYGHIPVSTFDFYKQQQTVLGVGDQPRPQRKSSKEEKRGVRHWQNQQKDKESLQKLDGLLIQHMEAEKDTIKRIASSVKSKS